MINAPEVEAPLVLSGKFNRAVLSEPLRLWKDKTIALLEKKKKRDWEGAHQLQDASRRTGILGKGGIRKGGVRCGMDTSHLPSPPSPPGSTLLSTARAESHPASRSSLAVPVGVYLVLGFQTSLLTSLYFPHPQNIF